MYGMVCLYAMCIFMYVLLCMLSMRVCNVCICVMYVRYVFAVYVYGSCARM